MPTFTVFTPTYNRTETWHRGWESLVAQNVRDFEWGVANDGSTDNTQALLTQWAQAGYKTRSIERALRTYYVNEGYDTMSKGSTVRQPLTNVYRKQDVLNFEWRDRFYPPSQALKTVAQVLPIQVST